MYKNDEKIKNLQLRKEDWQSFIEPDHAVSKQGESFPEILSRYIDEMCEVRNIRQKDISDATGIESSLITKEKKITQQEIGKKRHITKQAVNKILKYAYEHLKKYITIDKNED